MGPTPNLLTLVLLLSTSCIEGGRNTDIISGNMKSICDDTDGFCSELVCSYNRISLGLNVDKLKEKEIDFSGIHLKDRTCNGFPYDDKQVNVTWLLGEDICGTDLIVTNTHGIYKNMIFLPPAGIIVREKFIINVTCSYPISDLNVSLTPGLRPDLSTTIINIGNNGAFKVKMAIYKDITYTTPYTDPVIVIPTKANAYVGVYIEDHIKDFSLLMVNCFSTPTNNPFDSKQYEIIMNKCPNPKDKTIVILENGVSSRGRFYIEIFQFNGDYTYVFFHCQVNLCLKTCAPDCSGSRAADNTEVQGSLTIGPIKITDAAHSIVDKTSGFSVITMIGLVLLNSIFL